MLKDEFVNKFVKEIETITVSGKKFEVMLMENGLVILCVNKDVRNPLLIKTLFVTDKNGESPFVRPDAYMQCDDLLEGSDGKIKFSLDALGYVSTSYESVMRRAIREKPVNPLDAKSIKAVFAIALKAEFKLLAKHNKENCGVNKDAFVRNFIREIVEDTNGELLRSGTTEGVIQRGYRGPVSKAIGELKSSGAIKIDDDSGTIFVANFIDLEHAVLKVLSQRTVIVANYTPPFTPDTNMSTIKRDGKADGEQVELDIEVDQDTAAAEAFAEGLAQEESIEDACDAPDVPARVVSITEEKVSIVINDVNSLTSNEIDAYVKQLKDKADKKRALESGSISFDCTMNTLNGNIVRRSSQDNSFHIVVNGIHRGVSSNGFTGDWIGGCHHIYSDDIKYDPEGYCEWVKVDPKSLKGGDVVLLTLEEITSDEYALSDPEHREVYICANKERESFMTIHTHGGTTVTVNKSYRHAYRLGRKIDK